VPWSGFSAATTGEGVSIGTCGLGATTGVAAALRFGGDPPPPGALAAGLGGGTSSIGGGGGGGLRVSNTVSVSDSGGMKWSFRPVMRR
jgi:hypothetical protein